MTIINQLFGLISGGLEFLEISCLLKEDFDFEKFKKCLKKFSDFNEIPIYVVDKLPDIIVGKIIFICYKEKNNYFYIKALHSYYDGISITKIFLEIDCLYNGNNLTKKFIFSKNEIKFNKIQQILTNLIMNSNIKSESKQNKVEPLYVFKNISSSDVIENIQEAEKKDMVLLVSPELLNKNEKSNKSNKLNNNIIFKYVEYGENFRDVLKSKSLRLDKYIKIIKNRTKVIFLNNLCNLKLPSFVEKLTPEQYIDDDKNQIIKPIVIYPKTEDGTIEVFKG